MSNVVNINKLMHENAVLRKDRFKVRPDAVREYSSRVVDRIIDFTPGICEIAQKHNRKTVTEMDVIEFFSVYGSDVV